jgi:hypothetical protein
MNKKYFIFRINTFIDYPEILYAAFVTLCENNLEMKYLAEKNANLLIQNNNAITYGVNNKNLTYNLWVGNFEENIKDFILKHYKQNIIDIIIKYNNPTDKNIPIENIIDNLFEFLFFSTVTFPNIFGNTNRTYIYSLQLEEIPTLVHLAKNYVLHAILKIANKIMQNQ